METSNTTKKNNTRKQTKSLSVVAGVFLAISHIALVVLVFLSRRYIELSTITFLYVFAALVIVLIVSDILFIFGFKYRDKVLLIISIVFALALGSLSVAGNFALVYLNKTVDSITSNSGSEQYENISVTFASYKKKYGDIMELNGKLVGILNESSVGSATLAKEKLEKSSIDVAYSIYNTTDDLYDSLIDGTIDAAVFPSGYRQKYKNNSGDEEDVSAFAAYLDDTYDFYTFEEKVKTGELVDTKDVSSEPFNVLLIGFAPENEEMTYGLADTIIVATINPQTMTVSMTSIARDSYVPITCYGGTKDKINAARGSSRACLVDTVSNLLDTDIDYYMEVNFKAVVDIVDALGGIYIWSPVEFVGQSSSTDRGEYTIWIPQGPYWANGEEALAFARERHAMPAGDFDRQQHQKEVITEIARGLVELRDAGKAKKVLEAAGKNLSTNLSFSQLTQVFNLIVNTKNYTTLDTFSILDIQSLRTTGYSSWYYNYSMHLPLWIYRLYNGSIEECHDHIEEVLGNVDTSNQAKGVKFFVDNLYERPLLYSLHYNEKEEHEEMPAFYKTLEGMSYGEAVDWANANGASLNISFILEGEDGYNDSRYGEVISQSVKYGSLVSEYPTCNITVMGDVSGTVVTIPSFVEKGYKNATDWANANDVNVEIIWLENTDKKLGGIIKSQTNIGKRASKFPEFTIEVYDFPVVDETPLKAEGLKKKDIDLWAENNLVVKPVYVLDEKETNDEKLADVIKEYSYKGDVIKTNTIITFTVYNYVAPEVKPGTTPGQITEGENPGGTNNEIPGGESGEQPQAPEQPQVPEQPIDIDSSDTTSGTAPDSTPSAESEPVTE